MANPVVQIKRGPVQIADRSADFHPDDWLRKLHKIRPLEAALLAMYLDDLGSTETESQKFNYPVQPFNAMNGEILDVYTSSSLLVGSAYAGGGVSGQTLYVKMSDTNAKKHLQYDTVTFTNATGDAMTRVSADVRGVEIVGAANSYITIALLEADTSNALAGTTVYFTITGRADDEVSELPDALYEEPTWYQNFVQDIRASSELSDKEIKEKERIEPGIKTRAKMQAWEALQMKREGAFIWAIKADKGRGRLMTDGIFNMLKQNTTSGEHIVNWKTDTTYSSAGETWLQGGFKFFLRMSEKLSRNAKPGSKKVVYCGSLAMLGIDELVYDRTFVLADPKTDKFGFTIREMRGLNQSWELRQHPLFSHRPETRRSMLVIQPDLLKRRTFMPLEFIPPGKRENGYTWLSAEKCGWRIVEGLQLVDFESHAWIDNVGLDK